MTATKTYSMTKAAALLGLGRNELFQKLRFAGLLYASPKERNRPKPKYVRAGILTTKFKMFLKGENPRIHEQTVVTELGLPYIKDLLNGNNPTLTPTPNNLAMGLKTINQLKAQLAV